MKTFVTFIIQVNGPTWFDIKTMPSCKDGARHLHMMMVRTRYLSSSLRKVVDPVIQRNGFFGHPENLLLSMIIDDRPHKVTWTQKNNEGKVTSVHKPNPKI